MRWLVVVLAGCATPPVKATLGSFAEPTQFTTSHAVTRYAEPMSTVTTTPFDDAMAMAMVLRAGGSREDMVHVLHQSRPEAFGGELFYYAVVVGARAPGFGKNNIK